MKMKKILSAVIAVTLGVTSLITGTNLRAYGEYSRVAVHDPSIVKLDDGSYYIIGSHLAAARSSNLEDWTYTANSQAGSKSTTYFNDIYTDLAIPEAWSNSTSDYDLSGNMWAPDILYNEVLGKYCMYLSVNGPNYNSSIVMCTADDIDGPYTYVDTIVYSGFTASNVNQTDVPKVLGQNPDISRYLNSSGAWNAAYGTNAIDPCVFYDESGNLWMIYGSWFGGLYMLELDENTGLRDYTVTYSTTTNVSDAYMGKKAAGGYYQSGEGPYIEYMKAPNSNKGYYYLFISYGYFNSNGGYNMRVFRSENPDGPYVDQNGNSAIYSTYGDSNIGGTIGERLMSNYQWNCNSRPNKAQGHNSALMDDDGKLYVIYHNKFDDAYGFHEVRVHQMFINEDGWLVAAPYEYSGETVSEEGYSETAMTGEYEFIFHTLNQTFVNETSADVETSKTIQLNSDGTITGDITGTWSYTKGTPYMSVVYNGVTYKGTFLVQQDESETKVEKMTFTATGNNTCIWGSKVEEYNSDTDTVDLTDYDAQICYNAESVNSTSDSVYLCDTSLISGVSYTIQCKSSGLLLDLTNGATEDGTNIEQWEDIGGSAQQWRIQSLENGYCKIVSMVDESKCVAIEKDSSDNGLNIELQTYSGADNQQWKLIQNGTTYGIVSKSGGDVAGLDMYAWSEENGGNVDLWEYWGGDCQLWTITPVNPTITEGSYTIRNLNSGFYISESENNIQQGDMTSYTIQKTSDGYYNILNQDGLAITVENASAENGANLMLQTYTGAEEQKFAFRANKDGTYGILSVVSGKTSSFDVYNISTEAGANICQWSYWAGNGQKFIIEPAEIQTQEQELLGDVNEDLALTTADIILIQKYLLNYEVTLPNATRADMDQNTFINGFDLALLRTAVLNQG